MHRSTDGAEGPTRVEPRALAKILHAPPARIGQVALGCFWCIDGLLKLQPYFFHHFVSNVIEPSAAGQPTVIGRPITWIGHLVAPHQALFVVLAAIGELSIGVGLLVRRTVKPALLLSIVWALNVWLTGEGLGGLFTSNTPSPLTGIIGTAPMYVFAALLVWPRQDESSEAELQFGLLGESGARLLWAVLWLGAAALWLFPSNVGATALSSAFSSAPSGASWLSGLHAEAARAVGGSGTTITVALAVISAEIGLSVLWLRGTRIALLASILASLVFWFLGEGLGGLLTGQATDIGTAPLMILIAALLLPLASRGTRAVARSPLVVAPPGEPRFAYIAGADPGPAQRRDGG